MNKPLLNITNSCSRNKCLDGLRGYAALAVVVYHSILMLNSYILTNVLYVPIYQIKENYFKITKFFLLVFNGHTAVNIFFVLSGIVLFSSLLRADNQRLLVITFSLKRIIRIYLPLVPCLTAFYLIFNCLHYFLPTIYPHIKFHAFVKNCLLYKMLPFFHGASWTLQAEILVIPVILLTFYMYKKFGIKILLILTSLSILVIDNDFKINFYMVNTWLYYFYLGFLCAIFKEKLKYDIKKNRVGCAILYNDICSGFFQSLYHYSQLAARIQHCNISTLLQ